MAIAISSYMLTKSQIKKIAQIYAGSTLISLDSGGLAPNELGITENEIAAILLEYHKIGKNVLGKNPNKTDLREIIKYVSTIF